MDPGSLKVSQDVVQPVFTESILEFREKQTVIFFRLNTGNEVAFPSRSLESPSTRF